MKLKQRDASRIPAAIQWHDGLLLEPQHFQELARRGERLLDYHLAQLAPWHYGLVRCEIDDKQLPDGLLSIDELEAVLPDGLVVRHSTSGGPRRDPAPQLTLDLANPKLKALFAGADPVEVHLAVASEESRPDEAPRYDTDAIDAAGDDLGGPAIDVPRLVPRLSLLVPKASAVPASARVSMPIARLKRDSKGYELVDYEPPRLAVAAGSRLHRLVANQIVLPLREKAWRLAEAARALSDSSPAEWPRKIRLERQVASLVGALPPLEALIDSGRAHPFAIYLALAAVVGQSASASTALLPPKLADYAYDHEDLLATFQRVRGILTAVTDGILETFDAYTLRYDKEQRRYQVELPDALKTRLLALGVRPLAGREGVDLAGWMREARIGVRSKLATMPARRAVGVARKARTGAPEAVRELLREIVLPEGGEVYWLSRQPNDDLEGDGPLCVFNVGDEAAQEDSFQITLYVSHDAGGAGA